MPKKIALMGITTALLLGTSACGIQKAVEPFKDAKVSERNTGPATVGTMPDGFSNFATKCDHGNRVYVVFHGDNTYGSVTVVPNAEGC